MAIAAMQANGAPAVSGLSAGAALNHNTCAFPALLNAKLFIDSHRTPCSGIGMAEAREARWSVAPNPASDRASITRASAAHDARWRLLAADGRAVMQGLLRSGSATESLQVAHLAPGLYALEVLDAADRCIVRIAVER